YLNSIKGILTPEQYTKFLENNFMMSANHHKDMKKGAKHGKSHKDMKGRHDKKGHKDMKGRDSKKEQKS
ncbi:MAG: hypothetical protein K2M10_04235, partial [Muribaculaceae bacterium]|nr:hypothetical protein [Muribaculaceae bacterium]